MSNKQQSYAEEQLALHKAESRKNDQEMKEEVIAAPPPAPPANAAAVVQLMPAIARDMVAVFLQPEPKAENQGIRTQPGFRKTLKTPNSVPEGEQQADVAALVKLEDAKECIVDVVGSYLLAEAKLGVDFDNEQVAGGAEESGSAKFVAMVQAVVENGDPEFILKLARYTRHNLGIRRTTNFILALAAQIPECKPFIRRYFPLCVRLPSDVLEIAELSQKIAKDRVLPSCLRKGISDKFKSFNEFQLAKYNNEQSVAKKRRLVKEAAASTGEKQMTVPAFSPTLKQLVRTLHICEPVAPVMKLLGKRYPETAEDFAKAGLGEQGGEEFDEKQAGKRMKLDTPMTWETQLSARGNTAAVWEDLVSNNNLPFTAMLRNLRNVLQAGISDETHEKLMGRLSSAQEVGRSGQMPMRMLSAYQAIDFDAEELARMQAESAEAKKTGATHTTTTITVGAGRKARTIEKKKPVAANPPTAALLEKYRKVLDSAVQHSVAACLKEGDGLKGRTMVLVDASGSMDTRVGSAFARKQQLHDAALVPHAKSTGRAILEGEDYDLGDYFSSTGQQLSKKLSMSMIWIGRDLDLSCSFMSEGGEAVGHCSYTQLMWGGVGSERTCAKHSGDITNAPNGAEEVITLDLDEVPANVRHVVFTVNSYSGETFDEMKEAAISLRDDGLKGKSAAGTNELCAFRLSGTGQHRAVVACTIFRKPDGAGGYSGWALRCLNSPQQHGQTVHHLATTISKELQAQAIDAERSCKRLVDVAMLTSLCLRQAAERAEVKLFASSSEKSDGSWVDFEEDSGSVLSDMKGCHELRKSMGSGTHLPMLSLEKVLKDHIKATSSSASAAEKDANAPIDTFVVITDSLISPDGEAYGSRHGSKAEKSMRLPRWLQAYRNRVNNDLRFVCIDLLGEGSVGVELDATRADRRNLLISGYSDQVLKYVAQGTGSQLEEVEKMGVAAPKRKSE